MFVSAQVSLYPLRQQHLSPSIAGALDVFRKRGIDVSPGNMSTVLSGDDGDVFAALKEAFRKSTENGDVVMTVTLSNACPVPGSDGMR